MRAFLLVVTGLTLLGSHSLLAAESGEAAQIAPVSAIEAVYLKTKSACTPKESWNLEGSGLKIGYPISESEFSAFLHRRTSVVRSFSEALALRRLAQSDELKIFSEYWISRALFGAGLFEIASQGFNSLISRDPTPATVGVQMAALECMNQIHTQYSTLSFSIPAQKQIPSYFRKSLKASENSVLLEATTQLAIEKIGSASQDHLKENLAEAQRLIHFLKDSGNYEDYARALLAVRMSKYSEAVEHFEPLVAQIATHDLQPSIYQNRDQIRLFLARSYYALGKYEKSIDQYRAIDKGSNDLSHVLSELSWAHLMDAHYPEAIGIGISVQSGWMKRTFVPEALMVSAMALNELCRFPESLRMVEVFRREYRDSYAWLKDNYKNETIHFYAQAVTFLKESSKKARLEAAAKAAQSSNQETQKEQEGRSIANLAIPAKIKNEWIRSPLFISHQEELNLIFSEKKIIDGLGKAGQNEQHNQAVQLLKMARNLRKQYRLAKIRMKPGDEPSEKLKKDFKKLRTEMAHYDRLNSAAPMWRAILAHYQDGVPTKRSMLVSKIEAEIKRSNFTMYQQLNEIAENNELLEVEIYNGASKDIIRKNAQAQQKTVAQANTDTHSSGEIYNWGSSTNTLDGAEEIWEDELDSMKANLGSQCPTSRK